MEILLKVDNLNKKYGQKHAVKSLSFDVYRGECFGLLGPNGAGKSTTIECIEQIISFDSGSILFENNPLTKETLEFLGVQFQQTSLPIKLTVKEVLTFFSSLYQNSTSVESLIKKCQLEDFCHQYHDKISGGQRQKLLLAVALCHGPKLLILDEPTTGLDPQARRDLWNLVNQVKAQGTTIFLTTHYMDEAYELCDRIGIMRDGEFIALGTPDELLEEHFSEVILEFPKRLPIETLKIKQLAEVSATQSKWILKTKDVNELIKLLANEDIDLKQMHMRKGNLEDLFIHLTAQGDGYV